MCPEVFSFPPLLPFPWFFYASSVSLSFSINQVSDTVKVFLLFLLQALLVPAISLPQELPPSFFFPKWLRYPESQCLGSCSTFMIYWLCLLSKSINLIKLPFPRLQNMDNIPLRGLKGEENYIVAVKFFSRECATYILPVLTYYLYLLSLPQYNPTVKSLFLT